MTRVPATQGCCEPQLTYVRITCRLVRIRYSITAISISIISIQNAEKHILAYEGIQSHVYNNSLHLPYSVPCVLT